MSEIEFEDWFEWEDPVTETWEIFLKDIRQRASQWSKLGIRCEDTMVFDISPAFVMGIDICDFDKNCVMRTLRADFYKDKVICGHDPTCQFGGYLHQDDPKCVVYNSSDPHVLSDAAANWFLNELQRPIERHEWMIENCLHTKWKYSAADDYFMWSDCKNRKISKLGEPDRIIIVRSFTL